MLARWMASMALLLVVGCGGMAPQPPSAGPLPGGEGTVSTRGDYCVGRGEDCSFYPCCEGFGCIDYPDGYSIYKIALSLAICAGLAGCGAPVPPERVPASQTSAADYCLPRGADCTTSYVDCCSFACECYPGINEGYCLCL